MHEMLGPLFLGVGPLHGRHSIPGRSLRSFRRVPTCCAVSGDLLAIRQGAWGGESGWERSARIRLRTGEHTDA